MRWIHTARLRLRSLFRRPGVESELEEEIGFHLQQQIAEHLAEGMTPRDARCAALRDLGGVEQVKEECRDQRGLRWLDELWQDLRFGLRMLRRYPLLSLTVMVTLGLGIGLTSTVFSITNGFLHKPLPFDNSDRITVLGLRDPGRNARNMGVSVHDLVAWREQQSVFEGIAAFGTQAIDLSSEPGRPERYPGSVLTAGVFETLGVRPVLGRTFGPAEEQPGAEPVIVLGYEIWQAGFHGVRDVVGRTVVANGIRRTVIGVMPEGFKFPNIEQVWLPITIDPLAQKRGDGPRYSGLARLRDGVSARRAEAQLAAIASRLEREYPESNKGVAPTMRTLKQALVPAGYYGLFYTLLTAAFGVLLIGCANVANLLLARASTRTHEIAVRKAMGAGRVRLLRQLVTEVLVLALFGGAMGLVLGQMGLRWFTKQMFDVMAAVGSGELPFWIHLEYDYRVALFVIGATVSSGVFAAIFPAIRASAARAADAMRARGCGSTALRVGRFSSGLIVAEVAVAGVLLVLAGLMLESAVRLASIDLGYSTGNIFTAWVGLPDQAYRDATGRREFYRGMLPRLEAIPGAVSATISDGLPPYLSGAWAVEVDGQVYPTDADYPVVRRSVVTPDYFRTLEVPVRRGRAFNVADGSETSPVAMVNESFVRKYVPGGDALGRRIRVVRRDAGEPWMTVVGVVPDLKALPLDMEGAKREAQNPACFYVPLMQSEVGSVAVIAIRTQGAPMSITPDVRNALASVDPEATLYKVLSMEGVILRMTWFYPLFSTLFTAFGSGALFLAAVGLYGVMAFAVTQRTQELGLRMALGAKAWRLVWMVMRRGMIQLGVGLGIGLTLAAFAARPLQMLLYEVGALDPTVFAAVASVLAFTGLVASFLPARRVTRIDPMAALNSE